jgi:hypothetical protein
MEALFESKRVCLPEAWKWSSPGMPELSRIILARFLLGFTWEGRCCQHTVPPGSLDRGELQLEKAFRRKKTNPIIFLLHLLKYYSRE